jgi:hypothetical protein
MDRHSISGSLVTYSEEVKVEVEVERRNETSPQLQASSRKLSPADLTPPPTRT